MCMIRLESHKITSAEYLKILYGHIAEDYWFLIALVALTMIVMSAVDIRWLIVTLMCVFVVVPMIMSYLYIWHAMKPLVRLSILPKSVVIDDSAITIEPADEVGLSQLVLPFTDFSRYRITDKYLLLTFSQSKYLFFVVPLTVFKPGQLSLVEQRLSAAIKAY